ncbi:MAG: DNA translocase FtsK 4TM domain-containing protein [Anaerolineales bacterium]
MARKPSSTSRRKKSTARRKTSSKTAQSKGRSTRTALPIQMELSPDRKMELAGVLLAGLGLITVLGLFSESQTSLVWKWTSWWQYHVIGWGVYFFPFVLILIGLWMVLRNFERIPHLSVERLVGIFLLSLFILTLLHLSVSPPGEEAAGIVADQGKGGGQIGKILMVLLESGLGTPGMVIALIALLLIGAALTLDVSVVDLFRWVPPLVLRLQDAWGERRSARSAEFQPVERRAPPMPEPLPVEHTPQPTPPTRRTIPDPPDDIPEMISETVPSPVPQADVEPRQWTLPDISEILDEGVEVTFNDEYDRQRAQVIEETLASFSAPATVVEINRGPTITQFGVEPDFIESRSGRTRVRVGKISSLADDLSLALAASRIRVQAPVPGKGYVGIEVPNEKIALVALQDVIHSQAFRRLTSPLRFALGQDVSGNAVAADLAAMPHLLIAGATGSGKSVCVNAFITCLLLNNTPETLRMIMIDPKRVELTGYNGIPHLLAPVVTEIDRVVGVLQWVTREMDKRYQKFAEIGARNITDYNRKITAQDEAILPYLILVIDELADLMMISPDQTERLITRMAQLARATGIHLVISTQRPSVDVVTGIIKANFPARISFTVASGTDSRVILDQQGAERLLGRGDMLFQAPDAPSPVRLQGVFVSDAEILRTVQYWRGFSGSTETAPVPTSTPGETLPSGVPLKQMPIWEEMKEEKDPVYAEALDLIRRKGRASISMLQRRLRIGYTRAARLIETMEEEGIVGPPTGGSKAREVLDYGDYAAPPADEE